MCVFMLVMVQTTHLTSSWNLAAVTLNKYFYITNPPRCDVLFSWKRSLCGASMIWILSFTLIGIFYIHSEPGKFRLLRKKDSNKCLLNHLVKIIVITDTIKSYHGTSSI